MREPDEIGHGATRQPAVAVPAVPHNQENGKDRLKISPVARRVAEAAQIDPASLAGKGSGPGGRIVKQDILSFQQAPAAAAALPQRLGSGEKQTVPMTKMRVAIAKNLQASKQNIPHFYESIDVDVEELSLLRGRVNEILEPQKIRLSLGDFINKAVAVALQRNPALNSTFNGTEITRYGDVHLGMAVSVPDGLIVPVIRNIQLMGVKEIRQRTLDLVDRARAGRLKQDEMMGGTFTVSNLGVHGIREFSAIINPPQVAILAIAAATKRPVIFGGQVVARTMITFTLSADHRVIDGVTAAEFLRTLKELLEEPAMMMA
jgi:pyruvate dehydrogenase E2 component (dihydrolipoamide acetyltransferase)